MKAIYNFSIVILLLAVGFGQDSTNDYEAFDMSDAAGDITAAELEQSDTAEKEVNVRLGQIVPRHLCHRAIRNTQVTCRSNFLLTGFAKSFRIAFKERINLGRGM